MTVAPDVEARILRYYHIEKWRIGTIARQLHVHGGTVRRVLAQAGLPRSGPMQRASQVDAYLPFIGQTLTKYPTLTASRLYTMVRERGYAGGPDHFRHLISLHRPRPAAEAYLRLTTLPGEQGQVDWGLCRARHRPQASGDAARYGAQGYSCSGFGESLQPQPRCVAEKRPCCGTDAWCKGTDR